MSVFSNGTEFSEFEAKNCDSCSKYNNCGLIDSVLLDELAPVPVEWVPNGRIYRYDCASNDCLGSV